MLQAERHKYILNKVSSEGRAYTSDLATELNVAEDTIRKDLQKLSAQGLVKRVHGGVLKFITGDKPDEICTDTYMLSKDKLTKKAIQYLLDKKVIFLDNGTTNVKLAENLPQSYAGTIITNSPQIALVLCQNPNININLVGGELDKVTKAIKGSSALKALEDINIDCCVLGFPSISCNYGITVPSYEESIVKQKIVEKSAFKIAVVTEDKLEVTSAFFVAPCTSLDAMFVDSNVDQNIINLYRRKKIKIITVD